MCACVPRVCVCGCVMWRALVVGWMQGVSLADATSGLVHQCVLRVCARGLAVLAMLTMLTVACGADQGGAIYVQGGGHVDVTGSSFVENTAVSLRIQTHAQTNAMMSRSVRQCPWLY